MMPVTIPRYPVGPAYPMTVPQQLIPVYAPPRSRAAAALLAFFFGWLGVHRFYVGDTGGGVALLVLFFTGFITFGLTWFAAIIWAFVDFIVILCGGFRDSYGRPLT